MSEVRTVRYGLRLPNGSLARIDSSHNGEDRFACGEYSYRLTDSECDPEFLVNSPNDLIETLTVNTRWYNTQSDRPGWGRFSRKDLTPVKVTTTVVSKPLELDIPVIFECINAFSFVADDYAVVPNLKLGPPFYYNIYPCKEAPSAHLPYVGKHVGADPYNIGTLIAVLNGDEWPKYKGGDAGSFLIVAFRS